MKELLLSAYLLGISFLLNAAKTDTIVVHSPSMKKNIKACVVIPENYNNTEKSFPVLYLLHGYGGNYATFIKNFPVISEAADQYGMLLVCADGGLSGWYMDSPVDSLMRYETYITKELVV